MNKLKVLLLTTALTGVISSSYATDEKPAKKGLASTAEVSYIGSIEGDPMFHVAYNNSGGSRFSIRILDADGHQLYQAVFSNKKIDKKFKIANTEGTGVVVFVVRNLDDRSEQSFQVDSESRMIEEVEVKEVK